jgi:hypothetical protein
VDDAFCTFAKLYLSGPGRLGIPRETWLARHAVARVCKSVPSITKIQKIKTVPVIYIVHGSGGCSWRHVGSRQPLGTFTLATSIAINGARTLQTTLSDAYHDYAHICRLRKTLGEQAHIRVTFRGQSRSFVVAVALSILSCGSVHRRTRGRQQRVPVFQDIQIK